MATFISVEGVDSAAVKRICAEVALAEDAIVLNRKDVPTQVDEEVRAELSKLSTLLWPPNDVTVGPKLPVSYWVGLQVTWLAVLEQFVIRPRLAEGRSVVIDGWHYKFLAKISVKQPVPFEWEPVFSKLKVPDRVILVPGSLASAYESKGELRPSALGVHQGYRNDVTLDAFSKYQSEVEALLFQLADRHKWEIHA